MLKLKTPDAVAAERHNNHENAYAAYVQAVKREREALADIIEAALSKNICILDIIVGLREHKRLENVQVFAQVLMLNEQHARIVFAVMTIFGNRPWTAEAIVKFLGNESRNMDAAWIQALLVSAHEAGVLQADNNRFLMSERDRMSFALNGAEDWVRNLMERLSLEG